MSQGGGRILVTGATGFIGGFLCDRLKTAGAAVRGTLLASETPALLGAGVQPVVIGPLGPGTSWGEALSGVDTVIHLAARVHIMDDPAADPLGEFRKVNTQGTLRLAGEAARSGVRRIIFVSSIKVNGEESDTPYTADSHPDPADPYGISKWEAEQGLRRIEAASGLEVVVVRPTLVYGPGVKANFLSMMKIIARGIPLPFSRVANRRSLIYVGNLVDALAACAFHPAASGQTYLVSDGEDVSTPDLIRRAARALDRPARLFPVPVAFMRLAGRLSGKSGAVNRLLGSLTVDGSPIRQDLGWMPPFTMAQGLAETAAWFRRRQGGAAS